MMQLASEVQGLNDQSVKLLYRGQGRPIRALFLQRQTISALKAFMVSAWSEFRFRIGTAHLSEKDRVLLIHPQSLGYVWTIHFIRKSTKPVWLYLMDSSFFCVRSYNHIFPMGSACTLCVGGDLTHSQVNCCTTDFGNVTDALDFITSLREFSTVGKVKFIAQNRLQADLAKKHFGKGAIVKVAGILAADWQIEDGACHPPSFSEYDIVFHAPPLEAKGFSWALMLANKLPGRRFLFPFEKPDWVVESVPNCTFKNIRWESGLREAVRGCPLVLVPSLWSAPVEGALIKSIRLAQKTAVIKNETAYSSEVPSGVLLRLPFDVMRAAAVIEGYFARSQENPPLSGKKFYDDFMKSNTQLVKRLLRLTSD